MTLMNSQGKEIAKQTLATIKPLSSTNLSGGLIKALDQIETRKVYDPASFQAKDHLLLILGRMKWFQ